MTVVRLGVIGAGTISQAVHLPAVGRLAGALQLVAVHDLSADRTSAVARAHGARPVASVSELVQAEDVDAILIATPGSHADLARQALEAGRHVLAEKPLALTIEDVRSLEKLALDHQRVLQVGYQKMYDPAVAAAAARKTEAGELGLVRVTVLHPADAPQVAHVRVQPHDDVDPTLMDEALSREVAATERALGSAVPVPVAQLYRNLLNGSLIHELSLLRGLGFELPAEFTHAELWPWPPSDSPPSLLAVAPMGGARLVLSWNWLPEYPEYTEEVALFGRTGRLTLQMAPPYLLEARSVLRLERKDADLREDVVVRGGHDSAFVHQLERFAAAVRGEERVLSSAAGVVDDLRCLQGLVASLGRTLGFEVGGEAADR
jgi:predicted dehydrogenase